MFCPCAPATASVPITIFRPGGLERGGEHRVLQAERLLHRGEALVGVVADAQEPRLVLEVVLRHQADVRVEAHAASRRASPAPRAWPGRRAPPRCSRRGPRASSLRRRARAPSSAGPAPSPRRTRRRAAPATASARRRRGCWPRRRSSRGRRHRPCASARASRISSGVSLALAIWPSDVSTRGPGRTPRAMASRSALSRRRADALDGREAGHQRDVGVLGAVERGAASAARRPAVIAALRVEVPADVHVRVDEAGQQGGLAQINRHWTGRRAHAHDLPVADRDDGVVEACRRSRQSRGGP